MHGEEQALSYSNNNYSYVTILTTESYISGCLILNQSLKDVGSKYPFLVVCPCDISDNIKRCLSENKIQYVLLENLPQDIIKRNNLNSYWNNTLFKIKIFSLANLEKIVFLDTDMIILQNIDHLFEYPHMSASDSGAILFPEWKGGINSGLMVVKPEKSVYEGLLSCIERAYEKRTKNNLGFGDQDIIKEFYPNWSKEEHLHLPETYNTMLGYGGILKKANIIKSWKEIKVYHYTGSEKPWNKGIKNHIIIFLKILKRAKFHSNIDLHIYKHYKKTMAKLKI